MVKETPLERALNPTLGWNPITINNNVANFRCMNCGCLLGIAPRNMQGEFEHKCPICGHVHVFNRRPERWGTKHELESLKRMIVSSQKQR